MKARSEFYIYHDKFQALSSKAIDWFLRRQKYKKESPEWQICNLKRQIYMREAIYNLKKAVKWLKRS